VIREFAGLALGWVRDHPKVVVGVLLGTYLPLTALGLLFQRDRKIAHKWPWMLVAFGCVAFCYWAFPGFRRFVHAAALAGWCLIARLVGWWGRLHWVTITYWVVLLRMLHLYGWRAVCAGAPLNWTTWRGLRWLAHQRRHARSGLEDAHGVGGWIGKFIAGRNGVIRARILPAPGKSLQNIAELYQSGALGASWNYYLRSHGLDAHHRVVIRPVAGGAEGEGEIIALPVDPLTQNYKGPRLVVPE
jgi:hypothetical protein